MTSIEITEGFIKLTNECEEKCDRIYSRLSYIEIEQVPSSRKK